MVTLSLLVLRAADPARTRRFYEALGLLFAEEQHGTGPVHHACVLGATVLEIYPAAASDVATRGSRLGLRVDDVRDAYRKVIGCGAGVHRTLGDSERGFLAVVIDPDGRLVELTEQSGDGVASS